MFHVWKMSGLALMLLLGRVPLSSAAPVSVTEESPLSFGNVIAGFSQDIVITASDAGAAVFSATGDPNVAVTGQIVEKKTNMYTTGATGQAGRITVDNWSYGGNLASNGSGNFDGAGQLTNMRVGATATVGSSDPEGFYSGSATFRLVYQ